MNCQPRCLNEQARRPPAGTQFTGLVLLALMQLLCGCATFQLPKLPSLPGMPQDSAEKLRERKARVVAQYEEKRDQALLEAAQTRIHQGDEAGGRDALNQLLARQPEHVPGRLLSAELHLLRGEIEPAKAEVTQVLKASPNNPQALHAMGLALETAGDSKEAIEHYRRAAELAPDDEAIAMSYRAALDPDFSTPGKLPTAAQAGSTAASGDAMGAAAKTEKGAAAMRRAAAALGEGDESSAIQHVGRAAQLEPENYQIPRVAALQALRTEQAAAAGAILKPAVARFARSAELYRMYGLALYHQADYEAALAALEQAVALDNRDPLAYFLLGHALERLGRKSEASQHFDRAGQLDPALAQQR